MSDSIVVDTNIWDYAFLDENPELKKECRGAISDILASGTIKIVIDFSLLEGKASSRILGEYRHKLGGYREFEIIWIELERQSRIIRKEISLDNQWFSELKKLGFHEEEDHVFVATALAADRMIITEDSDYGVHYEEEKRSVYDYLTDELGLILFTASDWNQRKSG